MNLISLSNAYCRGVLILLVFCLMPGRLEGTGTVQVFRTSFEAAEGYRAGPNLVGQNGWLGVGSGGDGIVTNFLPNQVQSAFLGFTAPTNGGAFHALGYPINYDPLLQGLPKVTFSVQMAVYPATTNMGGWFDWTVFNTAGQRLFALEFPSTVGTAPVYYKLGEGDYQDTGQTFADSTPYLLKIAMDFAANRWSATLNSTVLVTNQPITTGTNVLTLGNIDAQWALQDPARPGDEFLIFDDYEVSAEPAAPPAGETLFQTSFEAAEGYQTGRKLVGQQGWLGAGSGGDGIVTNFFPNQVQSAFLGFEAPTNGAFHAIGYHLNFDPIARGRPLVTFSVQMAVYPSATNNQDWIDWAFFNMDREPLFALEFPTGTGSLPIWYKLGRGEYQRTGVTFSNSTIYLLTVTMDFASNRWNATLDSSVLVTNVPIASTPNTALTLGNIDAQWSLAEPERPGDDFMVFDDFHVRTQGTSVTPGTEPRLQVVSRSQQTFVLRLQGRAGTSYTLEGSSNLRNWSQLTTLSSPTGVSEFTDRPPAGAPAQFYRARSAE